MSFLEEKKRFLLLQKREILSSLEELPDDIHQRDQHVGDSIDKSKAQADHSEASDLRLRENQDLREIELALRRIENGLYEICEDCEDPIPRGRLDVKPTAKRCVDCQEDFEKFNKEPKPKRSLFGN